MKNFSYKTKGTSSRLSLRRRQGIILALGIGALLVVFVFGRTLGGLVAPAVAPFYAGATQISAWIEAAGSVMTSRAVLHERLLLLEQRLADAAEHEATMERMHAENEELRLLLGAPHSPRIAAGVIGRPPTVPYDVLYLDKGSADGIIEGAYVFHGGNRAIGYVSRVFARSALVRLLSSPGVETSAYILGPDIYTRAEGQGGGTMRVTVPQEVGMQTGDVVILPTIASAILGRVEVIDEVSAEPSLRGYLVATPSIHELLFVGVSTHLVHEVSFEQAHTNVNRTIADLLLVEVSPYEVSGVTTTTTATATDAAADTPQQPSL